MQYYGTVRYGYHAGKVVFNLTGRMHKFALKPKIGCYRLAYCCENIRTGLNILNAIIRSYLQCLIYIHNITNFKHLNKYLIIKRIYKYL